MFFKCATDTGHLPDTCFVKNFCFVGWLFTYLMVSLEAQRVLILGVFKLPVFFLVLLILLVSYTFGVILKKNGQIQEHKDICLYLFSESFVGFALAFLQCLLSKFS